LRTAMLGAMLGMLMILTIVAIMMVHLRPAPAFPGNRMGGHQNAVRFVEALDTLQNHSVVMSSIKTTPGRGDQYDRS
jgi:hypothetical protein